MMCQNVVMFLFAMFCVGRPLCPCNICQFIGGDKVVKSGEISLCVLCADGSVYAVQDI